MEATPFAVPPVVSNLFDAKTNLSQLVDRAAAGGDHHREERRPSRAILS
jgi:hypothetical protein